MSYNSRLTILWAAHNSGLPPHGAVIMSARACHNIVRTQAFPSNSFHILSWGQYFLWNLYHIYLCLHAPVTTLLGLKLFLSSNSFHFSSCLGVNHSHVSFLWNLYHIWYSLPGIHVLSVIFPPPVQFYKWTNEILFLAGLWIINKADPTFLRGQFRPLLKTPQSSSQGISISAVELAGTPSYCLRVRISFSFCSVSFWIFIKLYNRQNWKPNFLSLGRL